MTEPLNLLSNKIGYAPGTLKYIGENNSQNVAAIRTQFNKTDFTQVEIDDLLGPDIVDSNKESHITWLNVTGLHDPKMIGNIGSQTGIHPLALEDVMNTVQRPKLEEYPDSIFIVLKILTKNEELNKLQFEQISIVLMKNCVMTFQDGGTDIFEPVRKRLKRDNCRLRNQGSDYLAYVLMDTIVDQYYNIVEIFDNEIETCEDNLFVSSNQSDLQTIHELKRNILLCRKTLLPIRGLYGKIVKIDSPLIEDNNYMYFRDLEDHVNQIYDSIDTFREMTASLLDVYHSNVSNRMNEVMKVLTIISTIFIPLSFIAGVYGMNFKHMPELEFEYGYPLVMSVVIIIALCMMLYFKRKKWL